MKNKSKKVFVPLLLSVVLLSGCAKEPTKYTIKFDSLGGSLIEEQTIEENKCVTKPNDPTKEHYTFGGWYQDRECSQGKEYNFETPVTSSFTLFAKWNIDTFTVTFDTQGGSIVAAKTVEFNKTVDAPDDPSKDEHAFLGWFKEASCLNAFNFKTPITSNITLYAKWFKGEEATTEKELTDAIAAGKNVILKNDITLTASTATCGLELKADQTINGNGKTLKITLENSATHTCGIQISGESKTITIENINIDVALGTTTKPSTFDGILIKNAFNTTVNIKNVALSNPNCGYGIYILNNNEDVVESLPPVTVYLENCNIEKVHTVIRNQGNDVTVNAKGCTFNCQKEGFGVVMSQYPIYNEQAYPACLNANNTFNFNSCNFYVSGTGNDFVYCDALSPLNNNVTFTSCTFQKLENSASKIYVRLPDDDKCDLIDNDIKTYCAGRKNNTIKGITDRTSLFAKYPACTKITVDNVEYTKTNKSEKYVIAFLDENGDWAYYN